MAQLETVSRDAPLAPPPVSLTERAAEMVKKAREEEGMPGFGLRVGVIGGGCSGLQYLLDFAEAPAEGDFVADCHGVPVFVDPVSAGHLAGTVIDYVDGLQGSGFKFENPNIQKSCGCGSSFQP
jgi:iron-sulfur cluster assembly accessory protein